MTRKIVIDATNAVLGRLASYAAKQALLGSQIIIVNCENVLVSGRKKNIIEKYQKLRAKGGSARKGPHFPKNPERLVKRTVRGMLSHRKGRGLTAYKKVMCYNKIPAEYGKEKKILAGREVKTKTTKLSELTRDI